MSFLLSGGVVVSGGAGRELLFRAVQIENVLLLAVMQPVAIEDINATPKALCLPPVIRMAKYNSGKQKTGTAVVNGVSANK